MASHDNNGEQGGQKLNPVIVVMVPLTAHSHLNQVLHLSCLISSYNIQVHFISSATYNKQVKLRACGLNPEDINKIKFHDVSLPAFESFPPKTDSDFPDHLMPVLQASLHLREPAAEILSALAPTARRMIVVHDALTAAAVQDAHTISNAEFYAFNAISAFTQFCYAWEAIGKPSVGVDMPEELPSREGSEPIEFTNFVKYQHKFTKNLHGVLHNTCRSLDGAYVDVWAKLEGSAVKKRWAIGPLNTINVNHRNSDRQDKCLEWLDKQQPKSVLYVSFGTSVTLREEQVNEIAKGLEESKIKFLWVLKYADTGNIFSGEQQRYTLPEGFEERIERMGIIVRDWAPQTEILGHPSTGGFMSHCGWNSCVESMSMGVPMAAWPMHTDQPRNAILLMKMLKAGLVVREWNDRDKIVKSSQIKDVLCRLMESEEGDHIRKRAEELGVILQDAVKEGGVSRMELDAFISHITR